MYDGMMASRVITLEPIGIVHNGMEQANQTTRWHEVESEIVLSERWGDALEGLNEFSHLWIIFYFDRIPPVDSVRVRPMRWLELPLVGLFATRTPQRPNPLGLSVVELIEVRGRTLRVRGLEALDGSPVLDIKPYLPRGDAIQNTRVPAWAKQLWGAEPTDAK